MSFFKKTYDQLIEEMIEVLLKIKENIKDNSDCIWTGYENAIEIQDDINNYILQLKKGNKEIIDEVYSHFLPTSTYQEHSMSNDWTNEYRKLAAKFDKLYNKIKTSR